MQLAKTLSSYIARQFFAWFCGVFMAMVIVTFLLDYIELIRRSGTKIQVTLWVLLEMAALKLPHTAQEILPFAILFGTMLAFWRLTRNHELVVARAAGVSVWQFLTPAVLAALLIGVIAVTVFNPIASLMEAAYEKLDSRILRQGSDQLSLSDAGLWLRQSDQAGNQIIIHAERLAPADLILDTVTLWFFNDLLRFTSRIDGRTAKLEMGDWLIEGGIRWVPNEPPEPRQARCCASAARRRASSRTGWRRAAPLAPYAAASRPPFRAATPRLPGFWPRRGESARCSRAGR